MSVAAAVRIDSADSVAVLERAAAFAARAGEPLFVISVVDALPHGRSDARSQPVISRNLETIASFEATPVMQEASRVPDAIVSAARWFGVRTLFVQNGRSRLFQPSVPVRLLALMPPFEVVVVERR